MSEERLVLDGRYRLIKPLGVGGMADVYLAEQVSLGRKVALKVLKRTLTGPEMQARFKREAILLSTVDHPAVLKVLDHDMGPDGTVLVLEYVEGTGLDQLLPPGAPMDPARALRLLTQLARGLGAIHARGIIHRDVKPENVIVSSGPDGEQARLLDFGIARLVSPEESPGDGRSFVTTSGIVAGTPAYVAPEQIRGLAGDKRSDLYAFGITAFRLLTGRLPFEGPDVPAYVRQHIEQAPPSMVALVPSLKGWPALTALVERCLSKDLKARPENGDVLAELLEALAPVGARPPPPPLNDSEGPTVALPAAGAVDGRAEAKAPRSVGVFGALAVACALVAATSPRWVLEQPLSVPGQARLWLAAGQPARALALVESPCAGCLPVRAQALAALGRGEDVQRLLATHCYQVLLAVEPGQREALAAVAPTDAEGAACLAAARAAP